MEGRHGCGGIDVEGVMWICGGEGGRGGSDVEEMWRRCGGSDMEGEIWRE